MEYFFIVQDCPTHSNMYIAHDPYTLNICCPQSLDSPKELYAFQIVPWEVILMLGENYCSKYSMYVWQGGKMKSEVSNVYFLFIPLIISLTNKYWEIAMWQILCWTLHVEDIKDLT